MRAASKEQVESLGGKLLTVDTEDYKLLEATLKKQVQSIKKQADMMRDALNK